MAETPPEIPRGNDRKQPFDLRRFIRQYQILIVIGALILGGLLVRGLTLHFNGPSSLTDTHYYSDENGIVSIRWEWRRSAVRKRISDLDQTKCIVRGTIKNLDETRLLHAYSVDLILEDRKGIELDSTKHYFGRTLTGVVLKPEESKEFAMQYWVPTGFMRDVCGLPSRLSFNFKAQEQKELGSSHN